MNEAKRYIPLAAWAVVVITVLMIPAKILSYGYLPQDDALRHAAKAVSGKTWQDILVMRSDFAIDPNPGIHVMLEWIHRGFNCDADQLVGILVASMLLLVNAAALPWLKRPEAWLAVLLAAAVFIPKFTIRMALGRPYLFTMAAFMTMMVIWTRAERRPLRVFELSATVLLVAMSAWIHGSFYLLIIPTGALVVAGRWRQALQFGACWAAGSFLGCSLTGHPWQFLAQSLRHLSAVFGEFSLARQLTTELMPSDGDYCAVLVVVVVLLWRARSPDWKARELVNPLFFMGVLGWLLGFKVVRFWSDWGLPATLLWIAFEFEKEFQRLLPDESWQRLLITAGLAFGVYFGTTSDRAGRWTSNLTTEYITQDNKDLAGWLPDPGGIIYSADMRVFNDTFFKNPTAPWRYVLGFEPALMRKEDLDVVRAIDWNFGDTRKYDPWVEKMRPEDRLIIRAERGARPDIPKLEWIYGVTDLWIGRSPRR